MNKEQYRENNEVEFRVKFKGTIYVEALNKEEAIERAQDNPDLFEFIDDWEAE